MLISSSHGIEHSIQQSVQQSIHTTDRVQRYTNPHSGSEVFSPANSLSTSFIVRPIDLHYSGIFAHVPLQYPMNDVVVSKYFRDPSAVCSTSVRSHLTSNVPHTFRRRGGGPATKSLYHHTLPLKKNFYFLSTKFYKEGCSSGYYTNYTNKSF